LILRGGDLVFGAPEPPAVRRCFGGKTLVDAGSGGAIPIRRRCASTG
jgi:hypothetical protein